MTKGCIAGSTPQTRSFCPDVNVTRDEMAAFIVRAVIGTTTPAIYNPTPYFSDVPTTNPFFPHIQKLVDLGITTGCSQGPPALFCPTATIPRWEMAILTVRARLATYGAPFTSATTPYFVDVPTNVEGNGIPFPFIQRSYEEHISTGCGDQSADLLSGRSGDPGTDGVVHHAGIVQRDDGSRPDRATVDGSEP